MLVPVLVNCGIENRYDFDRCCKAKQSFLLIQAISKTYQNMPVLSKCEISIGIFCDFVDKRESLMYNE